MLPFYTRWLPIEGYGTVDIINIYVSFLIGVVTCAIAESVFIFPKGQPVYDYILCYHTLCFYVNKVCM